MGKIVPFSKLHEYLDGLESKAPNVARATILDTNILISAGYEVRTEHEHVHQTLDVLAEHGYRLLATVNTKAEFLEFQRRVHLTEALLDLIDGDSRLRVPTSARAKISTLKGTLRTAVGADPERDFVFGDQHLKRISAMEHELADSGVEYVSQHEPSQSGLFHSRIDWPDAIGIAEKTGASFSDSMILNAFRCSHCPFIGVLPANVRNFPSFLT